MLSIMPMRNFTLRCFSFSENGNGNGWQIEVVGQEDQMTYGNVYVACVAMGASDMQTVKAFREAEAWNGPSIIIAYSHCIAHGYDMKHGLEQQKLAVQSGYWSLDSKPPAIPLEKYTYNETRYTMLVHSDPKTAAASQTGFETSCFRDSEPDLEAPAGVRRVYFGGAGISSAVRSRGPTTETMKIIERLLKLEDPRRRTVE